MCSFDWESKKIKCASIDADPKAISFAVPAASSPKILIIGQGNCVKKIKWNQTSKTAHQIDEIVCRPYLDVNIIDRGGTSPDGTLYMSILPATYCKKDCVPSYPASAIVYMSSKHHSGHYEIRNALSPGTYTNGIAFDPKSNKVYIGEDCSASIVLTKLSHKSLSKLFQYTHYGFLVVSLKNLFFFSLD